MPFNDDIHLATKFLALRDKYAIKHIIETGTYHGNTTEWMAQNFENVYTCESNQTYFDIASKVLEPFPNVTNKLQDSRQFLESVLPTLDGPTIVFLDAHWYDNPLLGEIVAIGKYGKRPILAIHDFKVPGKPEFGYDTYPGIVYEWNYIKKAVEEAYGTNNFRIEYNEVATGSMRGCIFVYPKELSE